MNNDGMDKLKDILREKIKEQKEKETQRIEPEKPKDITQRETGLKSQISDLNEKMEMLVGAKVAKTKKKRFKLPFKVKRKVKKIAKKGELQVILLQNNKNIKPTVGELKEGMLFIGDKIYDGSTDCVWLWNGKTPTAIVAEWDLKPLTSVRLYEKTLEENSISHPQTIMIRAMELSEVIQAGKPKLGGKMMIWIIIFAVIGGYILFGNIGG